MTLPARIAAAIPALAAALAAPTLLDLTVLVAAGVPLRAGAGVTLVSLGLAVALAFAAAPVLVLLEASGERLGPARGVPAALGWAAVFTVAVESLRLTHRALFLVGVVLVAVATSLLPIVARWRRALVLLGAAAALLVAIDLVVPASLYRDVHAACGLGLVALALAAAAPLRARVRPVVVLGLGALGAAALLGVDRVAPGWQAAAASHGRHAERLLRAARALVDLDDDGFSPIAWGGDCDDRDPARHPLARDAPGGGDANCDGIDPPAAPSDRDRGLAPPRGDPAFPAGRIDRVVLVTIEALRPAPKRSTRRRKKRGRQGALAASDVTTRTLD